MYSIRRNLLTIVLAMASIFSMSVMNQASAATAEDLIRIPSRPCRRFTKPNR